MISNIDSGEVVILIVLLPFHLLLSGFVVSYLWDWFVVPMDVPPISLMHAIGLSLLVSYLSSGSSGFDGLSDAISRMFFVPIAILLIGAAIHDLM